MRHWIYPANPKIYNIIGAFTQEDKIPWPMSSNVEIGDQIYIYVGSPYKQILFKCAVLQTDLPSEEVISDTQKYIKSHGKAKKRSFMLLKTIKNFEIDNTGPLTFSILKQNGLKGSIMGPQCLENNKILFDYIKGIE